MSKGWMYILECADGSYYTGSTNNLDLRLAQHQAGEGANHTKKRLPVKLVYFEEFQRIDEAFNREKQVQGWSRKKKEALINGMPETLHKLAECMNETYYKNNRNGGFGSAQPPKFGSAQPPEEPPRCLSEVEGSEVEGSDTKNTKYEY
ncbi:MAG TPA: GIY-YIG nuclease family protein [Bacteroidales bacterium]